MSPTLAESAGKGPSWSNNPWRQYHGSIEISPQRQPVPPPTTAPMAESMLTEVWIAVLAVEAPAFLGDLVNLLSTSFRGFIERFGSAQRARRLLERSTCCRRGVVGACVVGEDVAWHQGLEFACAKPARHEA
jgi:hypothetical protein